MTPDTATLEKSLRLYADLGADVAYTEIDVRMNTPANATKLAVQAAAYARVMQACLNVKRCVGLTLWVSFFFFLLLSFGHKRLYGTLLVQFCIF